MELIAILIIGILSIINLVFFIYTIIISKIFIWFFIYLIISYLIIRDLYKKYLDKYQGIPIYIYLFMPGLGPIIIFLILFSLYYFIRDSRLIADYEAYITYKNSLNSINAFNYDESIRTISAIDFMNYLSASEKKEFITFKKHSSNVNSIKVLKRANSDEDMEVQHYSAVTINTIENKLNNEINELYQEYKKTNELKPVRELVEIYKSYIRSSLLEKESLEIFNSEYIKLLNVLYNREKKFSVDLKVQLVEANIRSNNLEKGRELLERFILEHEDILEFRLLDIKLLYLKADYLELMKKIDYIKKHFYLEGESQKLVNKVKFWVN